MVGWEEVIARLLEYNRPPPYSTLTRISPLRFERDWLAAQAQPADP